MKCLLSILFGVLIPGIPARAQVPITAEDTPILEAFTAFAGAGFAPAPGPGQLDADDFAVLGLSDGALPFGASGTGGDYARGTASGSVSTGGVYGFETRPGNFTLGIQPTGSDFTPGAFVVRYENATGAVLLDLNVQYGLHVYNDQDRSSTLTLGYAVSPGCEADPASLSFTDVPTAYYASPEVHDAQPSWQTVQRGVHLAGLAIASGACVYLRFSSDDLAGNGSRDQLALDDLILTANPNIPLPVELTSFAALVDGNDVGLYWETTSETNNAGFEVQFRATVGAYGDTPLPWHVSGFVEGRGTTLEPQTYRHRVDALTPDRYVFRLKQIDYDGTFEYSPNVEVYIDMKSTYHLSKPAPNPFTSQTTFSLSVSHAQRIAVRVYDLLGRQIAVLHDGPFDAQAARTFTFNAEALPSGLYLIRIQGERFAVGKAVMLTR